MKKFIKYYPFGVLFAAFVISYYLKLQHVFRSASLLDFDPYYFMAQSKWILTNHNWKVSAWVPEGGNFVYPPLLSWLGVLVSKFHMDLFNFYRYFGPFITSATVFAVYWTTKKLFAKRTAIIISILYIFIPYVSYRGIITLPENLNILWFWLAIGMFASMYGTNINRFTFLTRFIGLVTVSIAGILTHASFLYLIPIILLWLILSIGKQSWKIQLLSLFLILITTLVYFHTPLHYNATSLKGYIESFFSPSNWFRKIPSFQELDIQLHIPWLIFALVGWISLIPIQLKQWKKAAIFSVSLPLTFILIFFNADLTYHLGAILSNRFYPFVGIALVLLIGVVLETLLSTKKTKLFWISSVILLVFIRSPIPFPPLLNWFEIYSIGEVNAARWIASNTENSSIIITSYADERMVRAEANRFVDPILYQYQDEDLGPSLKKKFPDKRIYVLFSEHKKAIGFKSIYSDGVVRQVVWPQHFQSWGLSQNTFKNYKLVKNTGDTYIYQVQ